MLSVVPECGSKGRAQKPARVVRFDPLGCRELRAPTWGNLTSLYAARPPRRAARIGAVINFIPLHVQPFRYLSSVAPTTSAVSSSPTDENAPIFYPNLIKARMFLGEIRAEQFEAS
jgi:hypothetical protein